MYNRLLTRADVDDFYKEVEKEGYVTKFPHRDLWSGHDDAVAKWISIFRTFKSLGGDNLKVIDLGAGPGCLPHMISSLGHDVTAIDITDIDHLINQSLVKMVLGDVLHELKEIPPVSVDVFIDSCAVTHFAPGENTGWKQVANGVSKALKPGGKFIISSDVCFDTNVGEFIHPQVIIDIMSEEGLTLTSPYEEPEMLSDFSDPWPVVTFTFEK